MGENYSLKSYEDRKVQMNEIMQQLENGVRQMFTSENYIKYLEAYSKFYNYSISNAILILMQCPIATYVASFKDWNTKFHRIVKKGEHGIKILVPTPKKYIQDKEYIEDDGSVKIEQTESKKLFFKPGYVFDVTQTTGDELPTLTKNLEYDSQKLNKLLNLIFSTSELPILYDYFLKENDPNGYYRLDKKEIYLKPTLSSLHKLKTIAHEFSHYYQDIKYFDTTKNFNHQTKEVVAESTAFCVLQMLANEFQTQQLSSSEYSFGYIAGWSSKTLKELKQTLELISKISIIIYSWFSELFKLV